MTQHADLAQMAIDLVNREARLLDARDFDAWLALYAEEAQYWMPASPGQLSPDDALSLLYEDKRLLALRVRRLASPVIHIETPPSRCHHHVTGLTVHDVGAGEMEVRSMQLVVIWREGEQRLFSAQCEHRLRVHESALRIVRKTVRLIDCDRPQRGFAVPL